MDINIKHIDNLVKSISMAQKTRNNGNHPFGSILVDEHRNVLIDSIRESLNQKIQLSPNVIALHILKPTWFVKCAIPKFHAKY
jgi:hypothetical protein